MLFSIGGKGIKFRAGEDDMTVEEVLEMSSKKHTSSSASTEKENFTIRVNESYNALAISGWIQDYNNNGQDGSVIVFDDSFEHEVKHEGSEDRYIVLVVLKHPDVQYIQ